MAVVMRGVFTLPFDRAVTLAAPSWWIVTSTAPDAPGVPAAPGAAEDARPDERAGARGASGSAGDIPSSNSRRASWPRAYATLPSGSFGLSSNCETEAPAAYGLGRTPEWKTR